MLQGQRAKRGETRGKELTVSEPLCI